MKKVLINFKVGNFVKVKKGILDPDNPEYCIEDWQGRIVDEYITEAKELLVLIKWDSLTLKKMPKDLIKQYTQEDLDFSRMWLSSDEIERAEKRGNEEDASIIIQELSSMYSRNVFVERDVNSKYNDEQAKRIVKILDGVDIVNKEKVTEKWANYLDVNLKFPFKAEIVDLYRNIKGIKIGEVVNVKKIEGMHDSYGVVVEVKKWLKNYQLPLSDLEVFDKSSQNYTKVDDYNFWFANP